MIAEKLSKAIKTLMLREPLYGLFCIGLNKSFKNNIPTAGVGKNGIGVQLTINPDFFTNLNDLTRMGLLKHELLHIAFGHLMIRDLYKDKK